MHNGFCQSVLAECNFDILLTWTSEEGLPLFKEDVVNYFSLLLFVGGHCLQEQEGFSASGCLVLTQYLGIYGLI